MSEPLPVIRRYSGAATSLIWMKEETCPASLHAGGHVSSLEQKFRDHL